jgi:hypothetical protein
LAVANLVSKDSSRVNWSYYVLDATVGDAVVRAAAREATCRVSLIDADGQPVSVDRFDPRNDRIPDLDDDPIGNGHVNRWRSFLCMVREDVPTVSDPKTKLAFVAPLLFGSGLGRHRVGGEPLSYVSKLTIPRKVRLSLDELKKVASVKCELTFRAEDGDGDSGKSARGRASVRGGKK